MSQRQFISFTIGGEEYGVDIIVIREIKGWTATTELPDAPAYMRGVIDLRGTIVPILDLRARFNRGRSEPTPRHVIMVVAVGRQMAGLLVDAVADIITVSDADIKPVPEMERRSESSFLAGLVTVEGRLVALLDLDHMFAADDLSLAA